MDAKKIDALLIKIRTLYAFTRHTQEDDQLGLFYIATYCNTNSNYSVKVLDEYNLTVESYKRIITESLPKVVGFYCDHENIWKVIQYINFTKRNFPEICCVAGGPQVSAKPWDKIIFERSQIDVAAVGEGEQVFLEILDAVIKKNKEFSEIPGIIYRSGKEIIANKARIPEKDIDIYPMPDRNLNYFDKRPNGIETLITSRGCLGKCAFCFEGRPIGVRARSVESVLDEVEHLLDKRDMVYVAILDDIFTLNAKRVAELCDGFRRLQDKYHKFAWFCEGRADIISKNPQIAKKMHEAGLIRIQIGVESGNQKVLDAYKKGITLSQIQECVDICYEADILSVIGNVIIGGAFEDRDTLQNTQDFTCDLMRRAPGCYDFNTTIYTPYPGTAMYEHPEDYGMKILDYDCTSGRGDNYAFSETSDLSKWEILDARHILMDAFEREAVSLIPVIPERRRLRHFKVFYLFGIQTIWFTAMSGERRFYNYYGLQVSSEKKGLGSFNKEEIVNLKPFRTINIGSTVNGKLILPFINPPMLLSNLGGKILELCCGKLTTSEIVEQLYSDLHQEVGKEEIEDYVVDTLVQFDQSKLVLFSEL